MADTTNAPASVDATKPVEETTRPVDAVSDSPVAESKAVEGDDVAASGEAASGLSSESLARMNVTNRAYDTGSLSPTTKQNPSTEEPTVASTEAGNETTGDDAGK
jgi:hypothetical protein